MRSPGGGEGDLSGPAIGATKNTLPAITVCSILVNNTYPYNVCSATRINWSRVTRAHAPRQVTIPPVYTVAGVALYSPGKMRSCTVFVSVGSLQTSGRPSSGSCAHSRITQRQLGFSTTRV